MDELKLNQFSSRLNFKVELLRFISLGFPLGGYLKRLSFWQFVLDRIQKSKENRWMEEIDTI